MFVDTIRPFVFFLAITLLVFSFPAFAQTDALVVDDDGNVGIGTSSPIEALHVHEGNIAVKAASGSNFNTTTIRNNGIEFDRPSNNWAFIDSVSSTGGFIFRTGSSHTHRMKIGSSQGKITFPNLRSGGGTKLCIESDDVIGKCGSSLRLKSEVEDYTSGLDIVKKLRPVTYSWLNSVDKSRDIGFIAEEVAKIDPILANFDKNGKVQGVKYSKLVSLLVNAINEQQTRIETLNSQLKELSKQFSELQPLVEEQLGNKNVAQLAN